MLSLWDFSIRAYALDSVKESLLKLQDQHNMDINHVLWAFWGARYGFRLNEEQVTVILASTAEMARHTTVPLRGVRRFLSGPRFGFSPDALQALRDHVLALELKSEELVLRRLEAATHQLGAPNATLDDGAARSEQLFTIMLRTVDRPLRIDNDEATPSPIALFRAIRQAVEDDGL